MATPTEVIEALRHPGLRVRTGLWLLPPERLAELPDLAARAGISYADIRQPLLEDIAPDQRFLRLDVSEFILALDSLCRSSLASDCLLVGSADLLIAKLGYHEREELWETLFRGYPYRERGLLLAIPAGAGALLPADQQLEDWRAEWRLIE